ncbi:MAG: GumC family protein [Planctomycetota bacterium]
MSEEKVEEKTRERTLRDVYYVLFRHKWKMLLFLIVVVGIVTVSALRRPDIFRSEAKLMLRLGRESVTLDPTVTTGQIIPVGRSRESEIISELEILKSRILLEKVVDTIGPLVLFKYPDDVSREDTSSGGEVAENATRKTSRVRIAAKKLRNLLKPSSQPKLLDSRDSAVFMVMSNLEAEALKNSTIINISYKSKSPKLAQDVLAKLIDLYLEKHIAVHQTPGSYQFFTQQSDDLRGKLAQAESELRNLKDKTGISSLEEQRLVIVNRIGDLEQQTGNAEAELTASRAKVKALQETLAGIPEAVVTGETTGFSDYAADLMRARLYELQMKEQDLVSKFAEDSRQVQMIRQEVAEAKALLEKEKAKPVRSQVTKGVNSAHQQVQSALLTEQASLSSLQAKVEDLKRQLAGTQARLKTLNDAEFRITQLKREIDVQEANYRKYSENLEQARIDNALEIGKISNISVVQPATLPVKPIGPRRMLNIALGFLLGIFGAMFLAFFSEYIDHSIKTPEEVEERLQLPAAAYIPNVRANLVSPIARRRALTTPGGKVAKEAPAQWLIPINVREYYEVLRERLLICSGASTDVPRIIAVIGCRRGEGTTTVAANLAATLARHDDGPVLLMDTDIGHPSVHRIFNTRLSPGFADALAKGRCNVNTILASPVHNLQVLSAGDINGNGNASEMFNSIAFSKLLKSMRTRYRFVVIDVPAAHEVSWAVRLAGLCDGVVLVVEAERLRWEVAQNTKEQLLNSNANVLGVVLNKRRFHIPEWLYQTL